MYGPIWQYQGKAEPVKTTDTPCSWSTEPFLALLPFMLLGSFDAPQFDESTTRPAASEVFVEQLAPEILGSFDRPLDVSSEYQSWSQPDSSGPVLETAPQQEIWLSLPAPNETEVSIPWVYLDASILDVQPLPIGSFDAPFQETTVDVVAPPWASAPEIPTPLDEAIGSFDRPLDVSDSYTSWIQTEITGLSPPTLDLVGAFDRSPDDTTGYISWVAPDAAQHAIAWDLIDGGSAPLIATDESRTDIPWLIQEPTHGALQTEALGSFDSPLQASIVAVSANPEATGLIIESLPAEILGSFDAPLAESLALPIASAPELRELQPEILGYFDRSPDAAEQYSAWSQPESVQLPELTPEVLENHLGFQDRDEGASGTPWLWRETGTLELQPEPLGFFDLPPTVAVQPLDFIPIVEPPFNPELIPEILGSFSFVDIDTTLVIDLLEANGVAIRTQFRDLVETPLGFVTQYPNAPSITVPAYSPWIDLEIDFGVLKQRSFGDGNVYRKRGEFRATLRAPAEDGSQVFRQFADAIATAFRMKTLSGVDFQVPAMGPIERRGMWAEATVKCAFFDDVRVQLPTAVVGAAAGFEDLETVVRTRFRDLVAGPESLPTGYEDAPFDPPDVSPWAEINTIAGDPFIAELGEEKTYRTAGVVFVRIHVPIEDGERVARRLADAVVRNFRAVFDRGVLFRVPGAPTSKRDGPWWTVTIECPFLSDTRAE